MSCSARATRCIRLRCQKGAEVIESALEKGANPARFVVQDTHGWGVTHKRTVQSSGWEILPHNVIEVSFEARTGFGR
jgi:hypothetical protein